jgi:hypothetical protein
MAKNSRPLSRYMNVRKLCSRSGRREQEFLLVYRVYFVSIEYIPVWMCEMRYAVQRRRVEIKCLCLLFRGVGAKRRPRRIIR